jgi:protein SCO1/2
MIKRIAPVALIALAILAAAGIVVWRASETARPAGPQIGGGFHLVDQNGRAVDQSILTGKWTAVFFGYTYCPDVCPTTLQTLGAAQKAMGPAAKNFQIVFVTVDPQRDTPAQLKDYLSSAAFAPGVIGLTGTPDQIGAIAKAYGVYYEKAGGGAGYAVNHSSAIYLMNPKGGFDSVMAYGMTPQETRDAVLRAMRAG